MYIVSSAITSDNVEADGRRRVDELHIDDKGTKFTFSYLAESDFDVNAKLAERAAELPSLLASNEIAANIYNVSQMGSHAVTTFDYSTRQQNGLALQTAYRSATGVAVIMMGDFIAALQDAEIEATLGLTSAQVTKLRTDVLITASMIASVIRGATGEAGAKAVE